MMTRKRHTYKNHYHIYMNLYHLCNSFDPYMKYKDFVRYCIKTLSHDIILVRKPYIAFLKRVLNLSILYSHPKAFAYGDSSIQPMRYLGY